MNYLINLKYINIGINTAIIINKYSKNHPNFSIIKFKYLFNVTTSNIMIIVINKYKRYSFNSFSILSPLFNLALEKTKNYKFRHTKLNYLRISNCKIKNSYFFSNTNKNLIDYSLNNVCSLEVAE